MKTLNHYIKAGLILLLASAVSAHAGLLASTVTGSTVTYSNVTEDITGLGTGTFGGTYGTPTSAGDGLDFNPSGLISSSTGGQYMETDAELQFFVEAMDGFHITELDFAESGDARLLGIGTAVTYADITATFFIDVLEVDGDTPVNENGSHIEPFGTFSLPVNSGVNLWGGTASLDIQSILTNNDVDFDFGATLIHITLDNLMYTQSEANTTATIKKKDADGFTVTAVSVPEPASAVLMIGMASAVAFIRRRFIG